MEKNRKSYSTDLNDNQWKAIQPMLTGLKPGTWPKRELIDAVLYVTVNGIKWRNLPHDFPPWQTVYSFFRRAKIKGLWDDILTQLVEIARESAGKKCTPTYAIIDSQSVKTIYASNDRGIDGGKKN